MKVLAALVLAVTVSPALAAPEEACAGHAAFAREMMESRQAGVPITELVALVKELGDYTALNQEIILQAYEAPRFTTQEHQRRQITEFQDTVYVACMRQLGKP
jgi:hypothetical protein